MKFLRLILLLFIFVVTTDSDASETTEHALFADAHPADRYEIRVLTYGPGGHPFTKFGHNAIWVVDRHLQEHRVYNFGTFAMGDRNVIVDFLKGRLRYWVSVTNLRWALAPYREENRSAVAQVLALSEEQEETMVALLHQNASPENRFYIYDYYQDNCSTRVRDLIDKVTGGALRATEKRPARLTWREHTIRLSQDDWPVASGLDLALGPLVDAKNTVWEEMFLPEVLQDELRATKITIGGASKPLVEREIPILQSSRVKPASQPARRWPWMLVWGSAIGALAYLLARVGSKAAHSKCRKSQVSHGALWGLTALSGLILGVLGTICSFFWVYTDHEIAYWNQNILLLPPLALVLPGLAMSSLFWSGATGLAYRISLLCTGIVGIGVALLFSPVPIQDTRAFAALSFPLFTGFTFAFRLLRDRTDS